VAAAEASAWLTRCNSTAVTTATLHPALTLTGAQLSLVVGTEGGTVVKCNADAWTAAQQVSYLSVMQFTTCLYSAVHCSSILSVLFIYHV
jgi:hypothetical protein